MKNGASFLYKWKNNMHSLNLKTGRNQVCILQYGYDNIVVLPGESGETNYWQSKIAIFCFTYK